MTVARFAVLGFGELANALVTTLGEGVVVWARRPSEERIRAAGATPAATIEEAVGGADCVLACVSGAATAEVADAAAGALSTGAVYADLATARAEDKESAARTIDGAGGRYVDAAVLGTVVASGGAVPVLAAGSGAHDFADLVNPLGMTVTPVDAPAGAATTVKLLRSVYMKGRDALVAEMMLAARRRGVDKLVAESIKGPGEEVPFPQLADRVLASLVLHAARRADELEASGEMLAEAGVDASATAGAVQRLRAIAELGLGADGERLTGEQVLDLLEQSDAR